MHVLLLRPVPGNERFGLGPFFRIEPLGMAYVAAALEARGHDVVAADLRFSRTPEHLIARHRPAWLVETARGCPFRCSFCSVWQLHERRVRERGIGHVVTDFATVGDHVFVADDLFWHHPARSR